MIASIPDNADHAVVESHGDGVYVTVSFYNDDGELEKSVDLAAGPNA